MTEYREDIQGALDRNRGSKIGLKKPLKNLPSRLHEGELVLAVAGGQYGNRSGALVLTDERILFVHEGLGSAKIEDFGLDRVTSIEEKHSVLTMSEIKVFAAGNDGRIKSMAKRDAAAFADAARQQLHKRQATPSNANAVSQPPNDPLELLKKLAELRDAGIITPEEFEAKKSALMALI